MASRKLKVFQAQFGFYDTVVAAPSRSAALRAWGTHQNLFASGDANVTMDEIAIAAATAQPETPLRRPIGSTDPFLLAPTKLPKLPAGPKRAAAKAPSKRRSDALARPAADRSQLDAAEEALRALDDRRKCEEGDFRLDQNQLEARLQRAQKAYSERRKAAAAKVMDARTAYRKAGGDN